MSTAPALYRKLTFDPLKDFEYIGEVTEKDLEQARFPGAQLGTVAVKYVRGYSIRLLFAITIFVACVSVLLKQLAYQLASSITITEVVP